MLCLNLGVGVHRWTGLQILYVYVYWVLGFHKSLRFCSGCVSDGIKLSASLSTQNLASLSSHGLPVRLVK